jgi:hypothetical protein
MTQGFHVPCLKIDTILIALPPDSKKLATYLKVIWSHKIFISYKDDLSQLLSDLGIEDEWNNHNTAHCNLLEKFEAQTEVVFIKEGPY